MKPPTRPALIERLKKKRVRVCYSMHECCLCSAKIKCGESYFDGGYGKRAHAKCVATLDTVNSQA